MDFPTPGDAIHIRFSTPLDERTRDGIVWSVTDADTTDADTTGKGERTLRFCRRGTRGRIALYTVNESDIESLRVCNREPLRRRVRWLLRGQFARLSEAW